MKVPFVASGATNGTFMARPAPGWSCATPRRTGCAKARYSVLDALGKVTRSVC
ncbi:hypothetical protein KALB_3874 [Kutzneria albida DSM 43870]|uniref:Uncharacterized protein n=1 Tax=Kutzneria albida DSM 43870 TaxID=1449976 RepID=W5W7X5_9PSEU|nr:hypothetical protein KALB_3874 [Kutzneria albida DSM 43870]